MYSVEVIKRDGSRIVCRGFYDTDNIAATAARCTACGLFREVWIFFHKSNGQKSRGLRYDTGFSFS